MEIEILGKGAFESALVHLQPGDTFVSESGAMFRASANVDIDVTTHSRSSGGLLGGLKRLMAGESFFFSTYSTEDGQPGQVGLAPTHQGEVHLIEMDGSFDWLCAGGSFLGASSEIDIDTQFQGFKGFLTGEAPVFIRASGRGQLLVAAYGRIVSNQVEAELTVDTGHVVAFEETLDYSLGKAGSSWISSWLAGEGIVLNFSGSGRLLTQSHNPSEFGQELGPRLPKRSS